MRASKPIVRNVVQLLNCTSLLACLQIYELLFFFSMESLRTGYQEGFTFLDRERLYRQLGCLLQPTTSSQLVASGYTS